MIVLTRIMCALLVWWPVATLADDALPECPKSTTVVWHMCVGSISDSEGTYTGEWRNNTQHGNGTYSWLSGDKYIGEWKNGKRDGFGKLSFGRVVYEGDFKNNKRHGRGTLTLPDGQKYTGEFKDDLRNGRGVNIWSTGTRYEGEFRDGQQHGLGRMYAVNGAVAGEGLWEAGKFQKSIDLTKLEQAAKRADADGLISQLPECPANKNKFWDMCFGTYDSPSGTKYIGEFKKNVFSGQGVYYSSDGQKYIGDFAYGNYDGVGTLFAPDGTLVKSGFWEKDKLIWATINNEIVDESMALSNDQTRNDEVSTPDIDVGKGETPIVSAINDSNGIGFDRPISLKERRVALVIGNSAYKTSPLSNPTNDSTDMARALTSRGFKVFSLTNASLAQMRKAAREFSDEIVSANVALVFYSGHGLEVKGRNYFVPVDADIQREYEVEDRAFDASQITAIMESVPSAGGQRVNILIVDACRDNPLTRSFRSTGRGLARMDAPVGTFIAFSTAPGRVASDGQGRNSPFTKNLLKEIQRPNRKIEEVFKSVRKAVLEETNGGQVPWENSSLVGDFYFTTANR